MRQTLTTLTASIALGLGGLVAAPTQATTAPAEVAARTVTSSPVARGTEKPTRDLHDSIVKRHGKLYFKGRVDPGHGPVVVQKKECSSSTCKWKVFKRVPTHGPKERWQVRVFAPKHGNWYWRGYVKAYGGYAKSWTHVYKTYVTRF
jgi:hypothetical protein